MNAHDEDNLKLLTAVMAIPCDNRTSAGREILLIQMELSGSADVDEQTQENGEKISDQLWDKAMKAVEQYALANSLAPNPSVRRKATELRNTHTYLKRKYG